MLSIRKYLYIIGLLAVLLPVASCGEYQRMLKSTDYDAKLDFARRAFENKKYAQAATVLTDIVTMFKGTSKAEESLYLLALTLADKDEKRAQRRSKPRRILSRGQLSIRT